MTSYTKGSLLYSGAVILMTGTIFICRTDNVRETIDWNSAVSDGTAKSYREYVEKWRVGAHAADALEKWEKALKHEYCRLDLSSPYAVHNFIINHPEVRESDVRKTQYESVVNGGSYETLKRYLESLPEQDTRRNVIKGRIDSIIMAEVKPALKKDDYQELQRLSTKYSDWSGCQEWINSRISAARNNSAKAEWVRLANSKSEQDLRRFINKYSGTIYASQASSRIDALYDDFDFVKSKGTLKAYLDFADTHPNSSRVDEAWSYVANELEDYVFKRKNLGSNAALVKSTLSRYRKDRPYSGGLYGTGGYYSSPLQITTPSYGNEDYFVKLVNKSTGRSVGIYVRSGITTEVAVPDGTYSVRYATGTQWYGTRFLFGLNAHYNRASGDFTFSNGRGYTLTLQKVANGNLYTSPMSASDF